MTTGMALIDGLPTVIGGVSSREFLQSIEVLDNSVDEAAPLGMDWRISAHALMHPVSRYCPPQHVHKPLCQLSLQGDSSCR